MTPITWPSVLQAFSYAALAIIALLTFLRARKTILAPLRTEIFKLQVDELREILAMLLAKNELELRSDFGFEEFLRANSARLYHRFFRDVFGIEVEESGKPYSSELCSHSVIHESLINPQLEDAGPHFFRSQNLWILAPKPANREEARNWWREYVCGELRVPNTMTRIQKRLSAVSSSPLLPQTVGLEMAKLHAAISSNRDLLFETLSVAGRALPDRHSDANPPTHVTFGWISDLYFTRFVALQPRTDAVVRAIKEYWQAENLLRA
jgi:hypothetical protein